MKPIDAKTATIRLEELCARAEHAEYELAEKLRRWGIASYDAEKIIAGLRQRKFVDNNRFAQAYVKDKFKFSKWGKRKIRMGLIAKRIDKETIDDALDAIDPEEYTATIAELLQARLRREPELAETYEGRVKLCRFLMQRGFESALVVAQIKKGG